MAPHHDALRLLRRLRRLLERGRFERDLDDELRFHMEMSSAKHESLGHAAADVDTLTHREFGSMARYKEEVRDAHGLTLVDDVVRDVRFAVRALLRTPGFAIIALITFALGIGANAAIFSAVNAVLLQPLPYPNASRLVQLYETIKDIPGTGSVSYMNFLDWKQQATSFEQMGAYYVSLGTLDGDGEPERLREGIVTTNILPMLGVKPVVGRFFTADEETRGKQRVTLLSDGLWRRHYGADRSIVGRTISIEGAQYAVVGIMPPGFNFPTGQRVVDLWMPFVPPPQALDPRSRGWHWMQVVGLLKSGVSVERADDEMKQVAQRIQLANPLPQANRSAGATDMQKSLVQDIRPVLLVLLGAVGLVLLIACANVANLLLARNAARRGEVAVRVALGASRGQLTRQFLTESLVLALVGSVLGLGVALFMLKIFAISGAQALPISGSLSIDGRVIGALIAAAVVCGLAFGLAPALQLSRTSLRGGLASLSVKATGGSEMRRMRSGLVVAQIALSLMLLVGAGLLMRAFFALRDTDPGIVSARVLTARIAVPRRYLREKKQADALLRPMLERIRAIPGVRFAGVASDLPMDPGGSQASFWVDRRVWPRPGNEPLVAVHTASPGYLKAMGIRLKSGRDFTESDDTTSAMKVIVNEALAELLMPGQNPIGRHLLQGNEKDHTDFEIIGVIGNVKSMSLDQPTPIELFTSYADVRADWSTGDVSLVVKTAMPEASVLPQMRQAIREIAKDVAVLNVRSMDEVIDRSLSGRKLTLFLFVTFACVALALAASGLYGVIYYLVTQRTREIGIRVALGASKQRIVNLVVGQGIALVSAGIVVGLIGALLLSKLLNSLLYGVGARDPLTFVVVPMVLGAVAILATAVPAWRASRVDPVIALRSE